MSAFRQAVIRGWCHQQADRDDQQAKGYQVGYLNAIRHAREAFVEDCHRLEAEQRLDAGEDHARFFEDVAHVVLQGFLFDFRSVVRVQVHGCASLHSTNTTAVRAGMLNVPVALS